MEDVTYVVDSSVVADSTVELEDWAEPVTGELEVVEDSVDEATVVVDSVEDSVEETTVEDSVEETTVVDSVEDSVEEATVVLVEATTVLEVEATLVVPAVGPVWDGPVSAGDEGVYWPPVECSLVVCPCVVGVGVDLSVDLVTE